MDAPSPSAAVVPARLNPAWKALPVVGAMLFLHWQTVSLLVRRWYFEEDYTYCFFVPLVSLYLLWARRDVIGAIKPRPERAGFLVFAFSFVLQFAGAAAGIGYLQGLALILAIVAVVLILGGRAILWASAFPLLYLLLMLPLPGIIHDGIANPLQGLASRISAFILELLRIPVVREGNVLRLSNMTLEVAQACSGIRSLFGLVGMALLLGYLTTDRLWERTVLTLSAVPIGVAANVLRVAGTGMICHYGEERYALGFYHGFGAWVVFVFALAVLLAESSVIAAVTRYQGKRKERAAKTSAPEGSPTS